MTSLAAFVALCQDPTPLQSLVGADLRPEQTLAHLARLRKYYPPDVAALALETAQLRLKAAEKFSRAEALFFTREALQQASSERVAGYHAEKLRGWGRVADLGCGIGGDSLAIGQVTPVLGLDRDPLRLAMARHNAAIYGAQADFIQADLSRPLPWRGLRAAFFDPTRRMGEKRLFSVHDYLPPLDVISTWTFEALWVKLSPGLDRGEVASLGGGLEFISEGGDLKEALLCLGAGAFKGCRATRLPEGETLTDLALPAPSLAPAPLQYLYEPDPAVIRAGLFGEMLAHIDLTAYRLDETIAYLTGDSLPASPWVRTWRIDAWMPFHLKRLRAFLQAQGVGQVTVKKRGSPLSPEALQKALALKKGGGHAVVILTRLAGQPIVLITLDTPTGATSPPR